jgi:O-antigen ligase
MLKEPLLNFRNYPVLDHLNSPSIILFVCGVVALSPLGALSLYFITGCTAFFLLFAILLTGRLVVSKEMAVLTVFVAWTCFTYMVASVHSSWYFTLGMYIMPCVIMWFFLQFYHSGFDEVLRGCFFFLGPLIVVQLLYSIATNGATQKNLHGMANVGWGKSNYLAAILVMFLLWNYDQLQKAKHGRIILLGTFLFLLLGILFTLSKGGIIAACAGILLYEILNRKKRLSTLLLIGVPISIFLNIVPSLAGRFSSNASIYSRLYLWFQAIVKIAHKPFIGYGAGNVWLTDSFFDKSDKVIGPHNLLLEIPLHSGLIGLFFFVVLIALLFRKSIFLLRKKQEPLFLTFLIITLLNGLYEPTLLGFQYSFVFWAFVGYFLVMAEMGRTVPPVATTVWGST